jgi:hypothetical protein
VSRPCPWFNAVNLMLLVLCELRYSTVTDDFQFRILVSTNQNKNPRSGSSYTKGTICRRLPAGDVQLPEQQTYRTIVMIIVQRTTTTTSSCHVRRSHALGSNHSYTDYITTSARCPIIESFNNLPLPFTVRARPTDRSSVQTAVLYVVCMTTLHTERNRYRGRATTTLVLPFRAVDKRHESMRDLLSAPPLRAIAVATESHSALVAAPTAKQHHHQQLQ